MLRWCMTVGDGGSVGIVSHSSQAASDKNHGIRPAFYLNIESVIFKSASNIANPNTDLGKPTNPYILYTASADYAPSGLSVSGSTLTVSFDQYALHAHKSTAGNLLPGRFAISADNTLQTVTGASVTTDGKLAITLSGSIGTAKVISAHYAYAANDSNGVGFPAQATALKSFSLPLPILSITPSNPSLGASGGNNTVAVLTSIGVLDNAKVRLALFDGATLTAVSADATIASGSGSATLDFPANSSSMAKTYAVKASLNDGVTWESTTATVTVSGVTSTPPGGDGGSTTETPSTSTTPSKLVVSIGGTEYPAERQPDGSYLFLLPAGTAPSVLTDLPLNLTLPTGATITPNPKDGVDFSNGPVTFTITAQDKTTKKDIVIEVRISQPQTAEGTLTATDASRCLVFVTYNANGTIAFEIRLPVAANVDLTTLDGLYAYLSSVLTSLSFAYVDADGNTITLTPRSAGDPYLRIAGTAAGKSALESATLSSLTYWLKGSTTEYKQTFSPALKLSDMTVTYTNEPPSSGGEEEETGGSSGGGCDAGFGLFALLALGVVVKRRR